MEEEVLTVAALCTHAFPAEAPHEGERAVVANISSITKVESEEQLCIPLA